MKKLFAAAMLLILLVVPLSGCGNVVSELFGSGESRFGFIDKTGKMVIPEKFRLVHSFSNGLAAVGVKRDDAKAYETDYLNWGFIDKTGKYIVEPKYNSALSFSEKKAAVRVVVNADASQSSWGYGPEIGEFREGRAWGFIDTSGTMVIPAEFESVGSFRDGLAPARTGGSWGYIDTTGKFAIKRQFQNAANFSEGLAAVSPDGKSYGYIDKTGTFVIAPAYADANAFHDGAALVRTSDAKLGVINQQGVFMAEPKYDRAIPLCDGLAPIDFMSLGGSLPAYDADAQKFVVTSCGGYVLYSLSTSVPNKGRPNAYGYIDGSGKIKIQIQGGSSFASLGTFSEGLASCASGSVVLRSGYIDTTGKLVIPSDFQTAYRFSEGLAAVGYMPAPSF